MARDLSRSWGSALPTCRVFPCAESDRSAESVCVLTIGRFSRFPRTEGLSQTKSPPSGRRSSWPEALPVLHLAGQPTHGRGRPTSCGARTRRESRFATFRCGKREGAGGYHQTADPPLWCRKGRQRIIPRSPTLPGLRGGVTGTPYALDPGGRRCTSDTTM